MRHTIILITVLFLQVFTLQAFAQGNEDQQTTPPNAHQGGQDGGDSQTTEQVVAEITTNLSEKARQGTAAIAIGAHDIVREAVTITERVLGQNNPVLLGERGSGKSVTAETIAIELERTGHEVLELDLNKLQADTKYSGTLDKKIVQLFEYAAQSNGKVVIFIDEIHQIMAGEETNSIANKIKKYLLDPRVKVIGATTYKEWLKHMMKDEAIARRFQDVYINVADKALLRDIILFKKEQIIKKHGYSFDERMIDDIIKLGQRYFPDKPIVAIIEQLLDHAGAELKLMKNGYSKAGAGLQNDIERLKLQINSKEENHSNSNLELSDERKKELSTEIETLKHELKIKETAMEELKAVQGADFQYRQLQLRITRREAQIEALQKEGNMPRATELTYSSVDQELGVPEESLKSMEERLEMMKKNLQASSVEVPKSITMEQLYEIVANWKRINIETVRANGTQQINLFREHLNSHFVGNQNAIDQMTSQLKLYESGVIETNKPKLLSNTGVSNVGEKELYKQYAEFTGREVVRINMNDYRTSESINGLLGSKAGYVGSEDGGILTEAISKNPNGVFVFDNLDKAHESVKTVILDLINTGELKDAKGQIVYGRNITVVLNSSVLEDLYLKVNDHEKLKAYETKVLLSTGDYTDERIEEMSAEERFDETKNSLREKAGFNSDFQQILQSSEVVFEALTVDQARDLSRLILHGIKKHMRKKFGVEIKITDALLNDMSRAGAERMGAKNIELYALNRIQKPLSEMAESLERGSILELDTMTEKAKEVLGSDGQTRQEVTRHFSIRNTKTNVIDSLYTFSASPEAIAAKTLRNVGIESSKSLKERLKSRVRAGRR